jgi:hypothetical protein
VLLASKTELSHRPGGKAGGSTGGRRLIVGELIGTDTGGKAVRLAAKVES